MNLPLMLNRPKIHTKRIVGVDIEHSQAKTRLYLKQLTQEAVRWMKGIDAISNCVEVVDPDRPAQPVANSLMPERSNIQLPIVLMDVTKCQLNSAGGQLTMGQL